MAEKKLARLRENLQRRRRELLAARIAHERGVEEVREGRTDPEYEESAQADHVEYTLGQLSDAQRHELEAIDAALARMDAGTYGECIECGARIGFDRLEALPFALRCTECAQRQEDRSMRSLPTL